MLFPTVTFAVFFAVVLPVNWLLMPHPRWWRPFMIAASYVFYGFWDWHFVFLLAGSTLFNQACAVAVQRTVADRWRRVWVGVAVAGNLGLLGYFKYYDFFLSSVHNMAGRLGINISVTLIQVALPVGISFFTFMALSYVIDTYRGAFAPVSTIRFATFLSFFPHLVAGPIVRPRELIPQMDTPRDPRRIDASRALVLIMGGLFKKVVIASYLSSHLVDNVFGNPGQYSSLETLVAIYAYAVQIYCDFSGYTDIAIGVAMLLGFDFPQNFNAPYTARSLQEFWRRWHMTLSFWLRDYVYIPLGGNRGSLAFVCRNLMLTMLIGGLWHGAAWTFVVWGAIHGTGLVVERLWAAWRPGRPAAPPSWRRLAGQRLLTFQVVAFAWVMFRASTFSNAAAVLARLWGNWTQPSPDLGPMLIALVALGIGVQYLPRRVPDVLTARFSRWSIGVQAVVLAGALTVIDAMGPAGVPPFIYFRF
jgi:D-alanyl-lipoteichoic acid acyltransferase DltB (MBOAT superfamily)